MNKEIEIKIQLDEPMLRSTRSYLLQHATQKALTKQVDYYLDNPQHSFFFTSTRGDKDSFTFLRIRETEKGTVLCLKQSHKDPVTRTPLFAEEYETAVSNAHEALAFMKALGYNEAVVVKKSRETFDIDSFEIAIDQVDGLGIFMEIELKVPVETVETGWEMIYNWLKSVGITSFKRHKQGYIHLLMNPSHDYSNEVTL